jgi:hypothetical protein
VTKYGTTSLRHRRDQIAKTMWEMNNNRKGGEHPPILRIYKKGTTPLTGDQRKKGKKKKRKKKEKNKKKTKKRKKKSKERKKKEKKKGKKGKKGILIRDKKRERE